MFHVNSIASVFGPLFIIVGIWNLLFNEKIKKVVSCFEKNPSALYQMGIINLILGLSIVNSFNIWMWNFELLVTIMGWLFIVRGILVFFYTKGMIKLIKTSEKLSTIGGIIAIFWGIGLCYIAFG